jgi:hypothetical protein
MSSIEADTILETRYLSDTQPHSGRLPSPFIDQCRRLVASRYIDRGYVDENMIDENGFLDSSIDPYVARSEYFWKTDEDGEVIATLRVIHPHQFSPEGSLPIEQSFELYDIQALQLKDVLQSDPTRVGEISALAKNAKVDTFAALDMYREIWQYAKRTDMKLCAISADAGLYKMLKSAFGDAIVQAGETTKMMGSLTTPCFLYPSECPQAMVDIYNETLEAQGIEKAEEFKGLITYLREGLENEYFTDEEAKALKTIGIQ